MPVEELRLQREKVRVYALARELNMESKDLLDLCRQAGYDVKNQLSSLDPEQRDAIEQLVKRGGTAVAVAPPPKPAAPVIPTVTSPIRNLNVRPVRREPEPTRPTQAPSATPPTPPPAAPARPSERPPAAETPGIPPKPRTTEAPPAGSRPAETPPAAAAKGPEPVGTRPSEGGTARPVAPLGQPPESGTRPPSTEAGGRVRDLGAAPRPDATQRAGRKSPREIRPQFARIATPPPLKPRPAKEVKKAVEPTAQKPLQKFTPEMLQKGIINPQELLKPPPGEAPPSYVDEDEESEANRGKGGKARPVPGRDKRHQQRQERTKQRKGRGAEVEVLGGRVVVPVDEDRPQRTKDRIRKLKPRPITQPRKGKVPVEIPITVRALSEAIGIKSVELMFKLLQHGAPPSTNINSIIDPQMAELIALEAACELEIRRPPDTEDQLLASLQAPDLPEDLVPRAPVVTIMGHVDHGKTSLLDKIRASNVVATEAGGITQVIRAWRVDHGGRPITFLDTPGHEAFTKMRARGAQVTDIAVIVVAADDGVMPQTEEAINHAKAAEVPIVVAINKIDLPNANITKTRQQLYGLQLIPDTMGGDTPFVETSAATGKGIDELLDMLSLVAETMLELKANPHKPARGTCLEAMLSEGEGVRATLLVQDGTLHRGDVVLCGASYGHVRQMYDDLGRPIQEAGPSVPVRITGLDEVPNADDPFLVVPDLAMAREVAEKRKAKLREASMLKRPPVTLETLSAAKIAELKIILKADFRGSIEAIRKELDKFQHEEVRIRILHTGIGAITESDVQLALTSPEDTLIVGFNVIPDDRAKALAEEKGVQIRQYDIIYQLTDDIRAALEGKLKPREEVIHLGRAVVRNTFKISRVGTIAGCYVTQGVIERSAKIRLIREGVVIYPPPERTAGLESLKRYKDDVREVREGFECGLKIAGYDDVKVGDVIEAFRIEQVQRTL
jgi:translation initiation factor IF-2